MKRIIMATLLSCLACLPVSAEEKKPADELTTLRLRVLFLERENMALRAQNDTARKTVDLDTALKDAAKAAGIDLSDGWTLDLATKQWIKPDKPKPEPAKK